MDTTTNYLVKLSWKVSTINLYRGSYNIIELNHVYKSRRILFYINYKSNVIRGTHYWVTYEDEWVIDIYVGIMI